MRIVGIAGSLRKDSWNRKLLLAAAELLPEDVEFELWDGLKAVPPYDEGDDGLPAPPRWPSSARRSRAPTPSSSPRPSTTLPSRAN